MNSSPPERIESILLPECGPLNIIRTETVLSRLPIHNLAKKGRVDIRILKRNQQGQVDLRWEVSYSDRYGQPRQLAYKLDTLVVNRRIDEQGRPVTNIIRMGTLSQICRELGVPASGKNTNDLRNAFHQNAGAYVTARMTYRAMDGAERRLEAGFTRYGVIFTGETLPDGRLADGVYLVLNDPYRDVINAAPMRPLDYNYLRELRPGAQRFYEIVSYRIFAALQNSWPVAKLTYSDYCAYSAQQRYFDNDRFRVQMYKLHKPHLDCGYLESAEYYQTTDAEGNADWVLCYVPGRKARAEFAVFSRRLAAPAEREAIEEQGREGAAFDGKREALFDALVARGVTISQARRLAIELADPDLASGQLEWADSLIRQARPGEIRNPAGFCISLLRDNVLPPASFRSRRRPQARQEQEELFPEAEQVEAEQVITGRFTPEELDALMETTRQELRQRYPLLPPATLEEVAAGALRAKLAAREKAE
jgi:hypothetical protein